ncbi:MAG: peptidase dimerization domain-containing protein, partial [Lachnospiraceae bacterium]
VYIECISINGGSKDNAIPRECKAEILVNERDVLKVKEQTERMNNIIRSEYSSSDSDVNITLKEEGYGTYTVMLPEDLNNILFYLNNIPNGVVNMNPDIQGLVETSLNLGILTTADNCMTAVSAVRSSVGTRKDYVIQKLESMADKAGGFTEVRGEYPEWEFKKESYLRDVVLGTYKELYKREPVTNVIHAGLECGYLSSKKPDIDIVAMGPDIYDIHTTEERMSIESVARVYTLITEILKRLH